MLLDGAAPYYDEVVAWIDEALYASESSLSQQRIDDFRVSCLTDLIQVAIVSEMDIYRDIVKRGLVTQDRSEVLEALARLSLPVSDRKKKKLVAASRKKWEGVDTQTLLETLFEYTETMIHKVLPQIRDYSDVAAKTSNLTQLAKMEIKPEHYMSELMSKFMDQIEK